MKLTSLFVVVAVICFALFDKCVLSSDEVAMLTATTAEEELGIDQEGLEELDYDGEISDYETIEDVDSIPAEAPYSATAATGPFVEMFGEQLYKWEINEAGTEQTLMEFNTDDLLKDKKVIGVYFSASWCGPCRSFTPQLADFYKEMNKKGKKFEIVWVSRDQTADDFVAYFQKMPWLAVPITNLEQVAAKLGGKLQLKGIPHLVILDGYDGTVYTLDGRTQFAKDKYGLEFPWAPRTLMNALPRSIRTYLKSQISSFKSKTMKFIRGLLEGFLPGSLVQAILKN